jgi:hypothetical protein
VTVRKFAVLALVLGLLSGCADNGYHGPKVATMLTGGKPAPAAPASDEDKMRAFEGCMKDKGVEITGLQESPPSDEMMRKMQDAADACRDLLPNAGAPPPVDAKAVDEARKQAQCLRDHGVDARDPTQDRPYPQFDANPDSETTRKAMEECMGMPKAAEPTR